MIKKTLEDKKAQAEFKLDKKRQRTPYTALTLDEEYRVRTYGDAASALFGYDESEARGMHIRDILPMLADKLEKGQNQAAQPIQFSGIEMQAKRADGNLFPVIVGMRENHHYGNGHHVILIRNLECMTED